MNIKSINFPKGYKKIVAKTKDGFVLAKPNEIAKTMEVAFVNKQFSMLNEVVLQEYERHKYTLVINPEDTSLFGYLKTDSTLIFYDDKGEKQHQFDIKCAAAVFDNNNNLYIVERIDNNLSLSAFDQQLNLLATLPIEDPLFRSFVYFEFHQKLDRMFLSLVAGQDGSICYTVDLKDSTITVTEFSDETSIIEINDKKDHFLTIDPYSFSINYYTYPKLDLVSSFEDSDEYEDFDERELNCSLVYLEKDIYIIFYDGIPYMYDALKGKIIRELKIENHLPKPIKEFYPRLPDEGLMTDITSAKRFESIIAFKTMNGSGFYIDIADIESKISNNHLH